MSLRTRMFKIFSNAPPTGNFLNIDIAVSDLDAGRSGAAGTVDIFPATATTGKLALTAAASTGDTTTTIVNAYQRDMNRRWAELDKALRIMIVDNDVLGLSDTPPRVILQIQPAGRFTFPTDPAGTSRAFRPGRSR